MLAFEIGVHGVVETRGDAAPEEVSVRHLDGDPTAGVGLRVIGAGAVPMTLAVGPGSVGSTTTASAISAEGSWAGTCVRRANPPSG